jgi:CDP-diglyceride synthetase
MFLELVYDPTTNPLNNNEWSFPLLEIIHIAAFTLSVGTIAIVDLGLLGWGKRSDPAQLLKETRSLTLIGLVIMLITGPLIFSSDPYMYLRNSSFVFKMFALLVAIIYNYTIHKKVVLSGASPGVNKITAIVSLALWVSVVAGGLFIAFV